MAIGDKLFVADKPTLDSIKTSIDKMNGGTDISLVQLMWLSDINMFGKNGYVLRNEQMYLSLLDSPIIKYSPLYWDFIFTLSNNVGTYIAKGFGFNQATFNPLVNLDNILANATAMSSLAGNEVCVKALFSSEETIQKIVASNTAMTALVSSSIGFKEIMNNPLVLAYVCKSVVGSTALMAKPISDHDATYADKFVSILKNRPDLFSYTLNAINPFPGNNGNTVTNTYNTGNTITIIYVGPFSGNQINMHRWAIRPVLTGGYAKSYAVWGSANQAPPHIYFRGFTTDNDWGVPSTVHTFTPLV